MRHLVRGVNRNKGLRYMAADIITQFTGTPGSAGGASSP